MNTVLRVFLIVALLAHFPTRVFAQSITVTKGEGIQSASLKASAPVNKVSSLFGDDLNNALMTVDNNQIDLRKDARHAQAIVITKRLEKTRLELLACWRSGELLEPAITGADAKKAVVTTDDGTRHHGAISKFNSQVLTLVADDGKEETIRCTSIRSINSKIAFLLTARLSDVDSPPASFDNSWSGKLTDVSIRSCYDKRSLNSFSSSTSSTKPADAGRARKLALAVVGLMVIGAAIAIPLAVAIPLANRRKDNPQVFNSLLFQNPQPQQPPQQQQQQQQQN